MIKNETNTKMTKTKINTNQTDKQLNIKEVISQKKKK